MLPSKGHPREHPLGKKSGNATLKLSIGPGSSPHSNPSGSRGSPFSRFLARSASPKERALRKEPEKPDKLAVPVKLSESPVSPKLTGNSRLEKLLDEAIKEANERLAHSRVSVSSRTPPGVNVSSEPMDTSVKKISPSKGGKLVQETGSCSSASEASSETETDFSSCEEVPLEAEKPLKRKYKRAEKLPGGKRAKPRHSLSGWMYHKYPVLKFFATAPADAARYPHLYRCRVCLVELSLKTKRPLEILHHYRTDAHLAKEHRIRMKTPGLPLYDEHCNELTGMALKYAKERARREYPVAPKLGEYYLRIGQLENSEGTSTNSPSKEILSQLNLVRFGLTHGGHLDSLIALWLDLVQETKTSDPVAKHDWRPNRVFVSWISFH